MTNVQPETSQIWNTVFALRFERELGVDQKNFKQAADKGMYEAKRTAPGSFHQARPTMTSRSRS